MVVRYDPPEGYSPADLRYVKRMQYDNRCFSSDLLLNAVEGLLRIRRDKQLLSASWHLTSRGTPRGEAKEGRREVLAKLFADGPELDLDNSNATTIGGARLLHAKLLKKRFTPRMFKRNGGSIGIGFAIALLSMAAAIGIGVVLLGSGAVLLIPVGIAMLVALSVFGSLVKAPTAEGRKLLDQRSEEHTSELQSLKRISYDVLCLQTKKHHNPHKADAPHRSQNSSNK